MRLARGLRKGIREHTDWDPLETTEFLPRANALRGGLDFVTVVTRCDVGLPQTNETAR